MHKIYPLIFVHIEQFLLAVLSKQSKICDIMTSKAQRMRRMTLKNLV